MSRIEMENAKTQSLDRCEPLPDGSNPTLELFDHPLECSEHVFDERYRVTDFLGSGAFGRVYRARDDVLERDVALKIVPIPPGADSPEALDSLLDEARMIARLDHPHIIPVYDAGTEKDIVWTAMRLVGGGSLQQIIGDGLPRERGLKILRQLAEALRHAHRQGVVHRDLKPANVLLDSGDDEEEYVWLTDFGLSKVVAGQPEALERTITGTPAYMAPEQITGKRIGTPVDVFALGCVAVRLFTGRNAFEADSAAASLYKIVHRPPRNLDRLGDRVGRDLEKIVRGWLAKSPEDRPQTGGEVLQELERELDDAAPRRKIEIPLWLNRRRRRARAWDGEHVLVAEGAWKSYVWRRPVLRGLDLKVPRGAIFALLGRNGCGKTTLLRTLIGVYRPDRGRVAAFGRSPFRHGPEVLRRLGFVPEDPHIFDWMRVRDVIAYLRPLYPDWDQQYCYRLLERFALPLDVKMRDMSRGMQTKVSLLAALGHRPELLVLDDPTLGLDAVVLDEFLETLREIAHREGTTILIASHNHEELEGIVSHVALMKDGVIALSGTLDALKKQMRKIEEREHSLREIFIHHLR